MRGEVRVSRQGRWCPACTGGSTADWDRTGVERTSNIWLMVVTLEVSQLEMSASKFFKSLKSPLMLVMAETPQPAMGPYVALAAVGLALNSWTAVTREALVVKVAGQVPGPQLEPYPAEAKAVVPAHAQRMSSLLVLDREFASCRVERRAYGAGQGADHRGRGRWRVRRRGTQRSGEGSTVGWEQVRARSWEGVCGVAAVHRSS